MHRPSHLLVALALAACHAKSDTKAASAPPPPAFSPGVGAPRGPMNLSDAIPAEAFAVAAVRIPDSWLDVLANFDPFGDAAEDLETLRKDLDEVTRTRFGLSFAKMRGAWVFALEDASFAAIVEGVVGTPRGNTDAQGFVALEGFPDLRAVQIADRLVIGSPKALAAAVAAASDPRKRLAADADVARWISNDTDGAVIMAAIDVARAPKKLVGNLVGMRRGLVALGPRRFALVVDGEPDKMAGFAAQADTLVNAALAELQRLEASLRSSPDALTALGAPLAAYQARRLTHVPKPVVEGGRLRFDLPLADTNAMLLVASVGMGAAIAIPAFTKYMRRSKTSEARIGLAKMFDAASAYFNEELVPRARVARLAAHACPNDGRKHGSAGITPPLTVDCTAGPAGRCQPVAGDATVPGTYPMALWTDNPVWNALNFQMEEGHYFHYDFKWANTGKGYGACQFTAQAFGDLDGDGVWSTFERSGSADERGINAAAGLYIDQEVE